MADRWTVRAEVPDWLIELEEEEIEVIEKIYQLDLEKKKLLDRLDDIHGMMDTMSRAEW